MLGLDLQSLLSLVSVRQCQGWSSAEVAVGEHYNNKWLLLHCLPSSPVPGPDFFTLFNVTQNQ